MSPILYPCCRRRDREQELERTVSGLSRRVAEQDTQLAQEREDAVVLRSQVIKDDCRHSYKPY